MSKAEPNPPPAPRGGGGGGSGDSPGRGGPFEPVPPPPGASLRELAAIAAANAHRADAMAKDLAATQHAAALAHAVEARCKVYMALLEAATEPTGNFRHLFEAVRDSRETHPPGDARRDTPLPCPYPADPLDTRNDAAQHVAFRVLDGAEPLPPPEALLPRLAQPLPPRGPPFSDRLAPRIARALAEAALAPLDPVTERAVAGWPIYCVPWKHDGREEAVVRLVAKARAAIDRNGDPCSPIAALAALVLIERDSGEVTWRCAALDGVRGLSSDPALPVLHAAVLRAALDDRRRPAELAALVLAAARGDVPASPAAIADLVDRAMRAAGFLSSKTIDPDHLRRATRRVLTLALADPADGRLTADVLVGLHTVAAWPEPGRTPRFMLAGASLRSVVTGSPSRERRDRAAIAIALLATLEARDRGTDEREVEHGSHLADHGVTCSSVVVDVLSNGEVSGPVKALLRDVMDGGGAHGAALAERALALLEGGNSPDAPSASGATPAPTRARSADSPGAVRLFPFKESLETAMGTPRNSGYVSATLVRASGDAEDLRVSRAQYDALVDLAKKGIVTFATSDGGRKARGRLAALLAGWGVATDRVKPHVLRLVGRLTVHPADGAADRTAALRRFAREAEREARGQT